MIKFIGRFSIGTSVPTISSLGIVVVSELETGNTLQFFDLKAELLTFKLFNRPKGLITNCKNDFFFFDSGNNLIKFDTEVKELTTLLHLGKFLPVFKFEDKFIVSEVSTFDRRNQVQNNILKIYYQSGGRVWETDRFGTINLFDNLILSYTDRNIETVDRKRLQFDRLDEKTGDILWSFDFNNHTNKFDSAYPFDHLIQLQAPIGKYKDQLWFSVTNYGLLCLNYDTGGFVHYFRDCPENDIRFWGLPYGNYPIIPNTENAVLLESEGKIVSFDGWYYWELNLGNLALEFHYLQEYFQEVDCYTFGSRLKKLEVDGNKIYMVSIRTKKIACFNRTTLQYDWIENLPEESGAPKTIEKHSNRLYVETTKKELLIYELDKND